MIQSFFLYFFKVSLSYYWLNKVLMYFLLIKHDLKQRGGQKHMFSTVQYVCNTCAAWRGGPGVSSHVTMREYFWCLKEGGKLRNNFPTHDTNTNSLNNN